MSGAALRSCAIKSLTTSSGQSDTCQKPFCKSIIEALPDGWRMTKRRWCKLDGYALRRAEALLNRVGPDAKSDLLVVKHKKKNSGDNENHHYHHSFRVGHIGG